MTLFAKFGNTREVKLFAVRKHCAAIVRRWKERHHAALASSLSYTASRLELNPSDDTQRQLQNFMIESSSSISLLQNIKDFRSNTSIQI